MVGVVGSGQVAKHVIEELRRQGARFVVFTRSVPADAEPGVFVSYTLENIAEQIRAADVTAVINCAAMRDIALCQKDPNGAAEANVELPANIGDTVRQLYISTDYVFDLNDEDRPLDEFAESRGALSVYGQTKLMGEQETLKRGGVVARISSPWGRWPSPMKPSFVDMVVSKSEKIDLPSDQFFSPTYLPDVVGQLIDLATKPSNGVYHLVNGGKTNWVDFARAARAIRKNKGRVTGSMRWDKTRPMYGALINTRLPRQRNWIEAMQEYFDGPMAEGRISR